MQADAEIEFLQDIDQSILFGLLQYYGEKFFAVQEKFVPKIKPFDLADFYNYRKTVDLGGIWRFRKITISAKLFCRKTVATSAMCHAVISTFSERKTPGFWGWCWVIRVCGA